MWQTKANQAKLHAIGTSTKKNSRTTHKLVSKPHVESRSFPCKFDQNNSGSNLFVFSICSFVKYSVLKGSFSVCLLLCLSFVLRTSSEHKAVPRLIFWQCSLELKITSCDLPVLSQVSEDGALAATQLPSCDQVWVSVIAVLNQDGHGWSHLIHENNWSTQSVCCWNRYRSAQDFSTWDELVGCLGWPRNDDRLQVHNQPIGLQLCFLMLTVLTVICMIQNHAGDRFVKSE